LDTTSDGDGVKEHYYFGRTLACEIDYFAFPRTGSHFFRYCTQGLFDLVALRHPGASNDEAISRQEELNADMLYALDLREDGIPFSPVIFHTRSTGQHGPPVKREHPVIVLIRDPIATIYSYYLVARDRWHMLGKVPDHAAWIRTRFQAWHEFYTAARDVLLAHPRDALLIRYESLTESPAELDRLVAFVGVRPKLSPRFVHAITRFDALTRPGARTFYRAGHNNAWRADDAFCRMLTSADVPDPTPFGYARQS
jgi:hypothetical protein